MPFWFLMLCQFSILAYAILSGVFLAFSDFIMRALGAVPGGAEAMQSINREVFRYLFMALFLGMAPVSVLIAVYGASFLTGPGAVLIALSGVVYLLAAFGVTVAFNVPMNETLAGLDAADAGTQDYWTDVYLPRWTAWNGVRTVACTISSGLMLVGMLWSVPEFRG